MYFRIQRISSSMTMFFRIFIDVPHHGQHFLQSNECSSGTPENVKTKCQIQFDIDRISSDFERIMQIINTLHFISVNDKMPYASIFNRIGFFQKNPLK